MCSCHARSLVIKIKDSYNIQLFGLFSNLHIVIQKTKNKWQSLAPFGMVVKLPSAET